jgi:pimeloyl-ACP methyl ester carboxylesterase
MDFATTPVLRIAYEDSGPKDGAPVLLLHGWPDDPLTYAKITPVLNAAGFRTIVPWLRGFGPTAFLPNETMRSGEMVAMAQDALDLMDALGIERFAVAGHDWGARIAYVLSAAFAQRIARMAAMSVGWQGVDLPTPDFAAARLYWYQWFMATARGATAVHDDPKGFARILWETWAPQGWFADAEFEATAGSFENPDWPDVTVHSYRVRWGEAEKDPRYRAIDRRIASALRIDVPALVIHGGADTVTPPRASEGKERYFTAGYARHVLDGVGHFPTREAPDEVSRLLVEFLQT